MILFADGTRADSPERGCPRVLPAKTVPPISLPPPVCRPCHQPKGRNGILTIADGIGGGNYDPTVRMRQEQPKRPKTAFPGRWSARIPSIPPIPRYRSMFREIPARTVNPHPRSRPFHQFTGQGGQRRQPDAGWIHEQVRMNFQSSSPRRCGILSARRERF